MTDLQKVSEEIDKTSAQTDISEMANKILSQFENFSNYTKTEVQKLLNEIEQRDFKAQEHLDQVDKLFIKFKHSLSTFKSMADES